MREGEREREREREMGREVWRGFRREGVLEGPTTFIATTAGTHVTSLVLSLLTFFVFEGGFVARVDPLS